MDYKTQQELSEIVKKNYQEIANDFNETRKKQVWPKLAEFASQVESGDRVLDVGCGNGRLANLFKGKFITYYGLDNCQELIDIAKTGYERDSWIKFSEGDILKLNNFSELNFHYVFCVAVLHHLPGERLRLEALRQLKNKITPDGRIIIVVWNLWQQKKYFRLIIKFWLLRLFRKNKLDFGDILFYWKKADGHNLSRRYYHAFTKKELKLLAEKAGLKIEELSKDKFNYYLVLKK